MEKKEFFEKIDKCFTEKLSMECSNDKKEKLFVFMDMLVETNKVMDLTAIVDEDMIIMKHFVDSLEFLKLDFVKNADKNGFRLIDVGTGAGFPGVPLAIMCENIDFLLLDSLQKRVNFLENVIKELGLKNVKALHLRAEEGGQNTIYREKFDAAVSRGVSKINILAEYLLPFLKVGGKMVLYKMGDCAEEFDIGKNAISKLGGEFIEKYSYTILDNEPKRCLLVYNKIKGTPKQYPRSGNKPNKEPIK